MNIELACHRFCSGRNLREHFFGKRKRRDHAGAVSAVNTGLLDVFHDSADHGDLTVTNTIHVDFHRVLQKPIHQHWPVRRNLNGAFHITDQIMVRIDELHRPTAEHKGRPNENWVADTVGNGNRLLGANR